MNYKISIEYIPYFNETVQLGKIKLIIEVNHKASSDRQKNCNSRKH